MSSKVLPVPTVPQYEQPFCFYACTSMVLSYFGIEKSISEIIYEVTLNWPGDKLDAFLGELSGAIKDYLSDLGLEAHLYTDQDWNSIKQHIDAGRPLIAFVKAWLTHNYPNHGWVIRGYDDTNGRKVIYNEPNDDPGSQDPITYDPDVPEDGIPGRTLDYDVFNEHWTSPFPITNRSFIAVSYKGQGAGGDYFDLRGVGSRNNGRWFYHMLRMTRKFKGFELVAVVMESLIAAVAFIGFVAAGFQAWGQRFENWGHGLIDKGREQWNKGGVGGKFLGGILIGLGGIVAGVGYALDFVTGVVGIIVDPIISALDAIGAIGSIFTGSAGGSASEEFSDTHIDLHVNLHVWPWESRWGDNWEEISGSWVVAIRDFSSVDKLQIWWHVEIWGWGIDRWSLSRRTIESSGTVDEDELVSDGNHIKRFYDEMTNAQGIRKGFGKDKCYYGRDGFMTRVKLEVEARATRNGESVKVSKSDSVWGFSA